MMLHQACRRLGVGAHRGITADALASAKASRYYVSISYQVTPGRRSRGIGRISGSSLQTWPLTSSWKCHPKRYSRAIPQPHASSIISCTTSTDESVSKVGIEAIRSAGSYNVPSNILSSTLGRDICTARTVIGSSSVITRLRYSPAHQNLQSRRWVHNKPDTLKNEAKSDKSLRRPGDAAEDAHSSPSIPPTQNTNLLDRFPDLSQRFHRPSKEELLAAATGFWSRLRVRFKWLTIRSVRPFNMDDINAFFSWILLGHLAWIIIGTTTFFSLVIFTINTVFAQETLARWVGNYLTQSSGVRVVFESAIVPKWGDGVITFKNVFVSRRPGNAKSEVSKGSQTSAQAAAAAAALAGRAADALSNGSEEDDNYTQYDVSIETVNVTLSFTKWFNGRGLLRDVEIKGVRGVIDRTHVNWGTEYVDPRIWKHEHNVGDFELDSFKLDDLLVSIYQPGDFRPFSVSVFSADLPQLRQQWLFYDMLSANHISGSFDGSPFFIHPRQVHNYTGALLHDTPQSPEDPETWKKQSRIRVDGLKIDHLNTGVEGPFSWIQEGNVDIVADIMFPAEDDESLVKIMSDFYDRVESSVTSNRYIQGSTFLQTPKIPQDIIQGGQSGEPQEDTRISVTDSSEEKRFLIMDLRIQLEDVHAAVPLFTKDLSYVNSALIRPIVAYINSNRAFIPINCRVVKRVNEFDGSWTIHDSGLMEDLSREAYDAFARDVVDDQQRMRRIKKVGLWSLQLAVQALFVGLAGNMI